MIQSMVNQILTEFAKCQSVSEATKKLPDIYKQLNTAKFSNSLGEGMAIASGLGYSEVIDKTGLGFKK